MTIKLSRSKTIFTACLLMLGLLLVPGANAANEKVTLQLKWFHQYQFAGYYAALEKGFYAEEGLTVEIRERDPAVPPTEVVLSGNAQFGIADTSLVLQRLQGKPVVIMAAIFQHSPLVFISLKKSGIISPLELKNKRVMYQRNIDDAALTATFTEFGLKAKDIQHVPHTFKDDALLTSDIHAMSAYLTDQTFFYKKNNIDINIVSPSSYGVDFYGDMLFTSEQYLNNNPETVMAFRRASLKGWEYALANPSEVIGWIKMRYQSQKPRDQLFYEAKMTRRMIQPELIELGHINRNRFNSIVSTYKQLGMAPKESNLTGIHYQDHINSSSAESKWPIVIQIALAISMVLTVLFFGINRRLKTLVFDRTRELEKSKRALEKLSNTDSLTGLNNRRSLDEFLEQELISVARYPNPLSVVVFDIDHFKRINDNLGHNIGDQILISLAELVSKNVRTADMFGRWGGEEFLLICPQTALAGSTRLAELLRKAISTHDFDIPLSVHCSFGVAQLQPGETAKHLFSRADHALYEAKQAGRNLVVTATKASKGSDKIDDAEPHKAQVIPLQVDEHSD